MYFIMRLYILLFVLSVSLTSFGQGYNKNYEVFANDSLRMKETNQTNKINYSLQMGSSVGSIGKTPMFRTYVAPQLSFKVNERFTLSGGVMSSFGNSLNLNSYGGDYSYMLPINGSLMQNMVFASGSYQYNSKLTLFGSAYYEVGRLSLDGSNEYNDTFDTKGMSLGFEYKLGKHSSIQFEVQKGTGSPYGNSLFSTPGNRRSPFMSGF